MVTTPGVLRENRTEIERKKKISSVETGMNWDSSHFNHEIIKP